LDLNWIGWIVVGLAAGAIAKAILPGRQGGGWITTLALGVLGALLGGWVGTFIDVEGSGVFSLWTWALAVAGSLIVLLVWGLVTHRRRGR